MGPRLLESQLTGSSKVFMAVPFLVKVTMRSNRVALSEFDISKQSRGLIGTSFSIVIILQGPNPPLESHTCVCAGSRRERVRLSGLINGRNQFNSWGFLQAPHSGPGLCRTITINPILHTAWLNIHALTLKRNTAKYYFGEKSSFLHTFLKICCDSRKI